jgi:hypothetical protein
LKAAVKGENRTGCRWPELILFSLQSQSHVKDVGQQWRCSASCWRCGGRGLHARDLHSH